MIKEFSTGALACLAILWAGYEAQRTRTPRQLYLFAAVSVIGVTLTLTGSLTAIAWMLVLGWIAFQNRRNHQFPLRALKIDRVFVSDMDTNSKAADIVETTVLLGQKLGLTVIAEGIETDVQRTMLRDMNCRYGQGFLYSEAVRAEEAGAFLQEDWKWTFPGR